MEYKCKFITGDQMAEINELLKSDHAESIAAYGLECSNAGVEGFKSGIRSGCVKSSLLAVAGVGLGIGAGYLGKKIVRKIKEKKLCETF